MSGLLDHVIKYRDDSERTEDIFRKRQVWLSSPNQLNDTLECKTGEIPAAWQAATIRKLEEAQLIGMIGLPGQKLRKTLFSLSERKTKRWWKRFRTLSHRQKVLAMREIYADHHIELSRPELIFSDMRRRLSSVGIFSLSECNDNELMWAHYGGNHTGIAIGFGRNPSCKLGDTRHTLPVTYHLTKPTFAAGFMNEVSFYVTPEGGMRSEGRVSFEDDVFRSSISTKTPPWSYECEWRYIEETNGLFDWPGPLVSVIFGLRMKKERRRYYQKLIEASVNKSVDIFEVQMASTFGGLILKQL